jgi:erythromycin esterase-like protein
LRRYDCTPSERLSAEQNCEVLISATEYYKKQVSEPAGSQASWNTRDQHMTTTLLRIRAHLGEDTKIV